jgi:hypothetical protein
MKSSAKKRTIAVDRLRNQRITPPGPSDPAELVAWFGAVQAQEYPAARWGLGLRTHGHAGDEDVRRACDEGRILRTHVMRPTWHFVARADLRWMLELTATRVHRTTGSYQRQLGLDAATCRRAADVFAKALGDGQSLTRAELGAQLKRARIAATGARLGLLTLYAELEGIMCSGPQRDTKQTYAPLSDRAPAGRRLSREDALGELARRYLQSHAPATVRDFVWWSGLVTADARRGFEMNDAKPFAVDGVTYWTLGEETAAAASHNAALLPIYDEYLVAYRDRLAVPHAWAPVADREGRMVRFQHALVIDGQVVGTWRSVRKASHATIDVVVRRRLTGREKRTVAEAAERYGRFVDARVTVTTS